MEYIQVCASLFIGSHPETTQDIETLRQDLRVTAVVNLALDDDILGTAIDGRTLEAEYRTAGIKLRRIPVRDLDNLELARKLPECVWTLNELIMAGNTVYLHCRWGLGRSPTVAIAYLNHSLGWKLEESVAHLKAHRKCSPSLDAIGLAKWPERSTMSQ